MFAIHPFPVEEYIVISQKGAPELLVTVLEEDKVRLKAYYGVTFRRTDEFVAKLKPTDKGFLINFDELSLHFTPGSTKVEALKVSLEDGGFNFQIIPFMGAFQLMISNFCLSVSTEIDKKQGFLLEYAICDNVPSQFFQFRKIKIDSQNENMRDLRIVTHKTGEEREELLSQNAPHAGYFGSQELKPKNYIHGGHTDNNPRESKKGEMINQMLKMKEHKNGHTLDASPDEPEQFE